jgi:transcriptional regulator GlxA family with amidase domain
LSTSDALICSNCTGAFLLAESGLLDGKRATTHWGYQAQFRARYPNVKLEPENMLTHDGKLLCAGGGNAWFDLGLYLIERFCDHETAIEAAKAFVIDIGRTRQLSYSPLLNKRFHNDDKILQLQDWMHQHYVEPFSVNRLIELSNLSSRTLHRRFKQATGETPNSYLQLLRIEDAKKRLEQTHDSIEQITHAVGYNDLSSFSVLFKEKTGLSPRLYRSRYQSG